MGAVAGCQEASVQVQPEGLHQENLKLALSSKEVIDETTLQKALNAIAAGGEDVNEKEVSSTEEEIKEEFNCNHEITPCNEEEPEFPSMEETLPVEVLSDIINRVEDARDLANCMATSKALSDAVKQVNTLHLVCLKHYYDLARERFPIRPPCSYLESEEDEHCYEMASSSQDSCCAGRHYTPSPRHCSSSSSEHHVPLIRHVSFKSACLNMLTHVNDVERLRIEVDQEMQANQLIKEEIHMVDFWLSEPMFVRKWTSACGHSLQHLTLVDYGQQAIMRQTPILRILSETCRSLKTLELRNMYLDTTDVASLPSLTSLTLRCIKMTDNSLTDINTALPSLQTLALISVFGIQEAILTSPALTVLCLGLSTSAKTIHLDLPHLTKLQLKMTAPDSLKIRAPSLAYVAVCMESRDGATVEFEDVTSLRELLFGASHFATLSHLLRSNPLLEKLFLDLPCMALGEDGRWEGIVPHVPLRLPSMALLKNSCPALHTFSVGPGLWHAMEEHFRSNRELYLGSEKETLNTVSDDERASFCRWPALSRLIVHNVVVSLEASIALLEWLIGTVPSLSAVEVAVHLDSPVDGHEFWRACQGFGGKVSVRAWKRSLNFACFSF
jgi:hypothetical protein